MRTQNETVSHVVDADELSLAAFIVGDELEACVAGAQFDAVLEVALGTVAGALVRARAHRGPEGFEVYLRAYARESARAALAGVIVPTALA